MLCYLVNVDCKAPKRTSTCTAPAITQATNRKLVADSVTAALEAQAPTMANADNTNKNAGPRETPVAKKGNYKEFISCQPFYFNGTEGAAGLIRWFEQTQSNAYAQPIGIEQANKITWTELKRLLTNKYFPRTEVKKIKKTTNDNNYHNNHNNDHHQQHNRRQETFRAYAATPTENHGYVAPHPL
nr:hypothetical protein [Tanacetum cinerariifolium]